MGELADIAFWRVSDFIPGSLHGENHICASIAIRNGKNIQHIDSLLIRPQPGEAGIDEVFKYLTIYGIFLIGIKLFRSLDVLFLNP